MAIKVQAIRANPTPVPNELSSHPAHAKRDGAAAREKPAGIAVGPPSQEGGGYRDPECTGDLS